MLRIYGATYDHTSNYGSCFQAYALQIVIERMHVYGEKCEYRLIPISTFSDLPKRKKTAKQIVKNMIYKLHRLQFTGFEDKYMKYANISKLSDLSQLNDSGDAFVCGGDVIWSPAFNRNLGVYYLDFARKYKFSYAASFGTAEVQKNNFSRIREYLSSFNEISCREKQGADVVEGITGRRAETVLDPVLLLDREHWKKISENFDLKKRDSDSEKYIFVYITGLNKTLMDFVKKLKQETGYKIIHTAYAPAQALSQGIIQVQKPEQWLKYLMEAEFVVTNSFHATAFSVLFHKKFFTVWKGELNKGSAIRMYDFLDGLGLKDRMFSTMPEEVDLSPINFFEADRRLEEKRRTSYSYLKRNLVAAYQQKKEIRK